MVESSNYVYPPNISLKSHPLVEAWLDIRWEASLVGPKDPGFAFTLGEFYNNIKDDFRVIVELETNNMPTGVLPHNPRYQFLMDEGKWPVIQLGPRVAVVNFTDSYTYTEFKKFALYVREKLVKSYSPVKIDLQTLTLQYRNAIQYSFSKGDFLKFLQENLNVSIQLPRNIPGRLGARNSTTNADIYFKFDLNQPRSKGTLRIATATKNRNSNDNDNEAVEHVIFDLNIGSEGGVVPDIDSEGQFEEWLGAAHNVMHDWFFSLIEGNLRETYNRGE